MPKISNRLDGFTESVIRRMTRVANECGAINLSQGFPEFDPPQAILDRLEEVAHEGPHQYSITFGAKNFREALARKISPALGHTIDPETAPRNRKGEIDYESPFCLDVNLLNRHFAMLDRGETIHIPKYEFARQMRSDILSQPLRLGENELAIFEGIHALNDIIVGKNPHAFKLYIAARSNLVDENGDILFRHSWLRLCRRIVRDSLFRGSDAAFTLKMWENVTRGEKLYISPYKESANIMFDSSLAFEFSVLKPLVVPLLEALPAGSFPVVDDMLRAFEKIEPMDSDMIAPESLAREFIGGSTYDNH